MYACYVSTICKSRKLLEISYRKKVFCFCFFFKGEGKKQTYSTPLKNQQNKKNQTNTQTQKQIKTKKNVNDFMYLNKPKYSVNSE